MEKHKQEVLNMRITEWNQEEAIAVWREEGLEEGLEKGRAEGRVEGLERGREQTLFEIARKFRALGVSADQIFAATGLTLDELE
jgi:predicted transposase/invertase (TIGR01784 family)